ncbi:hypothetical protein D6764_03015 [Candidatus Woesearchaeota archaeon]|nr:MAG: hypothetical protein D6764_03015 [Candidatus Woesearchaeota archaeon]
MDVRNVQQTGNMFYLYLPTSWCRKHGIDRNSKLSISVNSDGTLSVFPEVKKKKEKEIKLSVDEQDQDIINKIIVACYIAPASSFKIMLKHGIDSARLLDQKKLLNVELVEFDGKNITCESSISVSDPQSLLRTMLTKIKNMISIMLSPHEPELLERYEEEIDRSMLLIEKSSLSLLSFSEQSHLKATDVHFISLLAKSFERITDHLQFLARKTEEKEFLQNILDIVNDIRKVLDEVFFTQQGAPAASSARKARNADNSEKAQHDVALSSRLVPVIRKVREITLGEAAKRSASGGKAPSMLYCHREIITSSLDRIMEVLLDWAVLRMVEER